MARLSNGGIIGKAVTTPTKTSAVGKWNISDQHIYKQQDIWVSDIIKSGLVLNLDASNASSYSGSGTTWYDLSGNGINATLVNGVGYSSLAGGTLIFDGSNDYVTLSSSQIAPGTGAFTWNFWLKVNDLTTYSIPFSGSGSNTNYGVIFLNPLNGTGGLGYYALGTRIADNVTSFGSNWLYINFIGNGGANGSRNLKLYKNTVQAGSTYTYDYNFTATTPIIGANHDSFAELMRGNIAAVSYYNRELSLSEIQQNYNATKGRFGL